MTPRSRQSEASFAAAARRSAAEYRYLADREQHPPLADVLRSLAHDMQELAAFWDGAAEAPAAQLSVFDRAIARMMRAVLGVTLTAKYVLERSLRQIASYRAYCASCLAGGEYEHVEEILGRMEKTIAHIKEQRVAFYSNVILGVNDALIELTGALVGFSFALKDGGLVLVAGLVTGLSASLSMAASAYQQARHDEEPRPVLAALYTGISYTLVALLLTWPFAFFSLTSALMISGVVVLVLVGALSAYSAILLARTYRAQLSEMLVFSVGIAAVAFAIGHILNLVLPT